MRRAGTVRPSLAGPVAVARGGGCPRSRSAVRLCRVGLLRVWSSIEDVIAALRRPAHRQDRVAGRAGPRRPRRRDRHLHPHRPARAERPAAARSGARCTCSTRSAWAGSRSTITFDPLTGCADPVTATERATDMLAAVSAAEQRWGSGVLGRPGPPRPRRAAARRRARRRATMRDVLAWVADPDAAAARGAARCCARRRSRRSSRTPLQFLTTNDRTRTSITSTIMPALGWLTIPAAAAAAPARRGGRSTSPSCSAPRATVYLLGAEETQAAPLVCALTGHIAREARRLAALQPGGRLDPPLTLALDEAALICPVPLDHVDRGHGRARGDDHRRVPVPRAAARPLRASTRPATILNNAAAVMVFGGTRDRDDLHVLVHAGRGPRRAATTDLHGRVASRTTRRVPVLAPAQIANLPAGEGGGVPPRHRPGHRAGAAGVAAPRRPHPPARPVPAPAARRARPRRRRRWLSPSGAGARRAG